MNTILKHIKKLIEIYYNMQDGHHIDNYLHEIIFHYQYIEIRITYKALKHIVERRKSNGYNVCEIYKLFTDLNNLLINQNYQIICSTNYPNTYIFTESIFKSKESVFIVIELVCIELNCYFIKTAFYRDTRRIKKIIK